ncbi:MAG: hypothetical protein SCK70_00140 [bacterium]|nr:hypothetical protein [bacterium]
MTTQINYNNNSVHVIEFVSGNFIVPDGWAQARGEIRGSVIDAVKQEPIPYAVQNLSLSEC